MIFTILTWWLWAAFISTGLGFLFRWHCKRVGSAEILEAMDKSDKQIKEGLDLAQSSILGFIGFLIGWYIMAPIIGIQTITFYIKLIFIKKNGEETEE